MYKCYCKLCIMNKMRWIELCFILGFVCVISTSSQAIGGGNPPHSRPLPTSQEDCSDENYCSDILGFRAISELHRQLDDDQDGHVDIAESDDFLREELQYENGQERQKVFHLNKKHITISDLWESWKKSEVHNWTVEETASWLADSVDLPQYSQTFTDNAVDGATLPRLAASTHFLSNTLGIRDQIHKRKISVKAMDAVLFGPSKNQRSYIKDGVMVALVCVVSGLCWYYHFQNRNSQSQLQKVMKDLESLQTAEDGLRQLQEQLDKANVETQNVTSLKDELEKKLHHTSASKKGDDNSKHSDVDPVYLNQLMEELNHTKEQLILARKQLEAKRWLPAPQLQMWLQLSYELELRNFMAKKDNAESELITAKEGCEKLRRKKTNFLGSFRLAHGSSIDNVDSRILRAKSSLTELTQELKNRAFRWKKIEEFCGFPIVKNPGFAVLDMALNPLVFQHSYGQNGNGDNINEEGSPYDVSAIPWSSGFAEHSTPPRKPPLLHRDSNNYLYDCLSSNAGTPTSMTAAGCAHMMSGIHLSTAENTSSENSVADLSESTNPPSLASSGGANHHPTFVVGESALDVTSEQTEERRLPPHNGKLSSFQKAKSFSQDQPSESQQEVINVSKSHSESTLNSFSTLPWQPKQHAELMALKQPLIENKASDSSPVISDEEVKDKKKKPRPIFKFKRSKHHN